MTEMEVGENVAEDINTAIIAEDSLLDLQAIDKIRDRMETYDKMREDVIKQARDVQKLSKLAIYSIHRGALKDSRAKLDQAMVFAMKILEIVNKVRLKTSYLFYNSFLLLIFSHNSSNLLKDLFLFLL